MSGRARKPSDCSITRMTLSQGKSIPALGQAWSRGLKPSLHGTLPEVLPFMLSRGGRSVHMRIDYDQIAHLYDENPLRKKRVDPHLERYLALLDDHSRVPIRAVDIACGTGNQASRCGDLGCGSLCGDARAGPAEVTRDQMGPGGHGPGEPATRRVPLRVVPVCVPPLTCEAPLHAERVPQRVPGRLVHYQ